MDKEKLKKIIYNIIAIIIGLIIGMIDAKAETLKIPNYLAIKNNQDKVLAECNNQTYCQVFNGTENLMYGQMTINYQFQKGYVYMISFDIDMEYLSIPNNIPSTTLRQNGLVLYAKDYSYYYYPTCTPQLTTRVVQAGSDGFGEFSTNTKMNCTIEMPNDYGYLVYINQSSTTGWIGGKISINGDIEITTVSLGNASIINSIENQTNEIINSGEIKEPTLNEENEKLKEEEKKLNEILGIPNYNDININIDTNSTKRIWQVLKNILDTNNKILTMIITIMSISIIKLVMNR